MRTRIRENLLDWSLRAAVHFDKRQPDPAELGTPAIQRILAISCTAIGDTLMGTPALASLRQAYPHAHIVLLVNPPYQGLFASNPDIDELIPYDGKWRRFVRTALKLRRQNFDLVVTLHGNEPQASPLAYLSGARWRFKLPNTSKFRYLLSNNSKVVDWTDFPHGIHVRMAAAKMAGGRDIEPRMVLPLAEDSDRKLAKRLQDNWGIGEGDVVIGFQVAASTRHRLWPADRNAELGRRLLERYPQLHIVITGSPGERELAERIAAAIGSPRVAVTAGQIPLTEMPALLQRCRVLMTPDTGTMHMAVAVGTPVVALFAATDHRRTGPLQDLEQHTIIQKWQTCTPCLDRRCPYAAPICMDNISVDEVEAACRRYLEPGGSA
jgi:lipopolysaccharide heptosyltransferase II